MARLQRIYSNSGYYHIMLRGNAQTNIFRDDEDRRKFIDILRNKKMETNLFIYAYCLMDNHIHLVLRDDENRLSVIMKGIATRYAMFFNNKYGRVGHVFQDRFKSESIEDESYLMAAIRYIHNNPVKAGMTETPALYEWSSYEHYITLNIIDKIVDSDYVLGMISQNQTEAIAEFKLLTTQKDDFQFMDDDVITIHTVQEGEVYLQQYLNKHLPGIHITEIKKNKSIMNRVILDLRKNTSLSIVKIAGLLGVNRGTVERVIPKIKKTC